MFGHMKHWSIHILGAGVTQMLFLCQEDRTSSWCTWQCDDTNASMHCRPYGEFNVQSLRVVCRAKEKHAFWFAAAISNMQFSQHGGWAHPYTGISLTFWQCRDVLPLDQKCSKHWPSLIPWQTWILWALTCLISINSCELSTYLRMECTWMEYTFFALIFELVLPTPPPLAFVSLSSFCLGCFPY